MKRGGRTDIQLRGAPASLAAKLRSRSKKLGKTMSQYAIEVLERDLSRPSLEEWLDEVRRNRIPVRGSMSAAQAVREAREEREEHLAGIFAKRPRGEAR